MCGIVPFSPFQSHSIGLALGYAAMELCFDCVSHGSLLLYLKVCEVLGSLSTCDALERVPSFSDLCGKFGQKFDLVRIPAFVHFQPFLCLLKFTLCGLVQ